MEQEIKSEQIAPQLGLWTAPSFPWLCHIGKARQLHRHWRTTAHAICTSSPIRSGEQCHMPAGLWSTTGWKLFLRVSTGESGTAAKPPPPSQMATFRRWTWEKNCIRIMLFIEVLPCRWAPLDKNHIVGISSITGCHLNLRPLRDISSECVSELNPKVVWNVTKYFHIISWDFDFARKK